MKILRSLLPILPALALIACSTLPPIRPADPVAAPQILKHCEAPFLKSPYRLVQSIEAVVAGHGTTLMGITLFDPAAETIHCALLTLEGFSLFEARSDRGVISVKRAIKPFDSPHFAKNMLDDIRLAFLAPRGRLMESGIFEADGSSACRYEADRENTMDVIVRNGSWDILTYGEHSQILRQVRASLLKDGIPEILELTGFMKMKYTLKMTLISAEPVTAEVLRKAVQGDRNL